MKFTDYIQREVVNPVDLEILDKTYNTLKQGHQSAIQATSALQAEMAKLDLNEAESAWRQQKIDEIKTTLENNSYMGNAYHALDDITKVSGDLFSNPELLGRLQAQQDYKTYMARLDASNLSEDKKEYFREQNPYYYQDKVDVNTGKIIGGTKWEPTDRFVNQYDYNKLYLQALQITAKRKGNSTIIYYKDANGNFTSDINQSIDGLPYYKDNVSYIELRKEDVADSVRGLLSSNPEAKASIEQDYKISKWKYDNAALENPNQLIINEYTDENGVELNLDEYVQKMFNPLYEATTYKHYTSDITALDGMKYHTPSRISGGNGSSNTSDVIKGFQTTPGPYMRNIHSNVSTILGRKSAAVETLRGYFRDNNMVFDERDATASFQQIESAYRNNGKPIPKAIYDAYLTYKTATEDYNQIMSIVQSESDKEAIAFAAALENGVSLSEIPNDNIYKQEYEKLKNYLLNNDKTGYIIKLKDKTYANAIAALTDGDSERMRELGVEERIIDGEKQLFLNKANGDNLYFVLNAIEPFIEPNIKHSVNSLTLRNNMIPHPINLTEMFLSSVRNTLSKIDTDIIDKIDIQATSEPIIGATDVTELLYNTGVIDNKDPEKAFTNLLGAAQGQNLDMYISYDGTVGEKVVDPTKRHALIKLANEVYNRSALGTTVINIGQRSLDTYLDVNINRGDNEVMKALHSDMKDAGLIEGTELKDIKYGFTIKVTNLFNSAAKDKIMQDPIFRAGQEFGDKTESGVYNYSLIPGFELDRASYAGDHILSYRPTGTGLDTEPMRVVLNAEQSKDAYVAGKIFDDLHYYVYSKNNQELSTNELTYISIQVMDIVKKLVPSEQNINAATFEELDINGQMIYEDVATKLNTPLI